MNVSFITGVAALYFQEGVAYFNSRRTRDQYSYHTSRVLFYNIQDMLFDDKDTDSVQ